jgi:hypothetical protein
MLTPNICKSSAASEDLSWDCSMTLANEPQLCSGLKQCLCRVCRIGSKDDRHRDDKWEARDYDVECVVTGTGFADELHATESMINGAG